VHARASVHAHKLTYTQRLIQKLVNISVCMCTLSVWVSQSVFPSCNGNLTIIKTSLICLVTLYIEYHFSNLPCIQEIIKIKLAHITHQKLDLLMLFHVADRCIY
jgi:hypothetical protein